MFEVISHTVISLFEVSRSSDFGRVQRLWLSSETLVEFRDFGRVQRLWLSLEVVVKLWLWLSSETMVEFRDYL